MACFYRRPHTEVQWYAPDSEQSQTWQEMEDGFGQRRNKSFREGCTLHPSKNRKGNGEGEMAGQILFYKRATKKSDYSRRNLEPTLAIHPPTKIFAKVFLNVPMGMLPIGENNIPFKTYKNKDKSDNLKGYGPVLLAPIVRAIALFVNVGGIQQTNQIFCSKSAEHEDNQIVMNDENENEEDSNPIITSPIPGSFVTFCPPRVQDTFFFIHLPILCSHDDCRDVETGPYALTVAGAFHKLFCTLGPGKHDIRVSAQIYYNYDKFRYFLLDRNMNARGEWCNDLPNDYLESPFQDTETLRSPDTPIAEGEFTVDMPFDFPKMFDGMLDRKPPREKYTEDDLDSVRKEAGIIAMGAFSKKFDVQGLPDLTVLTSNEMKQSDEDKKGTKFTFKVLHFTSCWLDSKNSSPAGMGKMFEGTMVKGQINADDFTNTWGWMAKKVKGEVVEPEEIAVKNKHILARMVERRRSQVEAMGDMRQRLVDLSKKMDKENKENLSKKTDKENKEKK